MSELFRFSLIRRVHWHDTDMQGVAFNGRYFDFIDEAIRGYYEAAGVDELGENYIGSEFYSVKSECNFISPAFFDDQVAVDFRCSKIGNSSIVYRFRMRCGERQIAEGEMTYVYVDRRSQQKARIPALFRERVVEFEYTEVILNA